MIGYGVNSFRMKFKKAFGIKDWDKICEEEGKMTSPIICYILLGVILFIILMRILSILQFLRLKRKVKKRISPKHDKPSCK